MSFESLGLAEPLLRAIEQTGYETPTPIQAAAIPEVMTGRDVLGSAQTGTGKTAAFALPILHRLLATIRTAEENVAKAAARGGKKPRRQIRIRCLVLSPTRELAAQIETNFRAYGKKTPLRSTCIFGGVNQNPQTRELDLGVDILVATPGRLLDLVSQGFVDLKHVEILVLDEADHMLDMGFLPDMKRILKLLPAKRQNLMFSATMPGPIRKLADEILVDPATIRISPQQPTVEVISQGVCFVSQTDKPQLLAHYIDSHSMGSTLVFTRTKHGANAVVKRLVKQGIKAEAIHGNKTQASRVRSLNGFKAGTVDVLVATDVAARGIDVDGIQTVINYDAPTTPEAYVHRIGRTGRAGKGGTTVMFCGGHETKLLNAIERQINRHIPVIIGGPGCSDRPLPDPDGGKSGGGSNGRGGQARSGRPAMGGQSSSGGHGGGGRGGKPGFRRRGRAAGSLSGTGSTSGRKSGPSSSRRSD